MKGSGEDSPAEMLLGAAGEEESHLLGAPQAADDLLDLLTPPSAPPEVAPRAPDVPAPFAKLLTKAKAVDVETKPPPKSSAPAPEPKKRRPQSFPDLPPDATKAPPPPTAEELPVGSPRGLEDLPTLVAAVRTELPTNPAETVDPVYVEARARATHHSLWDAADTGEAFPTPRQLGQAILWSLATGLVGFGLSYMIFVKNETLTNVPQIDRRAAETAPPLAYRSNNDAPAISFEGYGGGGLSEKHDAKGPDMTLKVPKVDAAPEPLNPTPTPTPTPIATATTNVDNPEDYPGGGKHIAGHKLAPVPISATPTPEARAARPNSKGWMAAWAEAMQAVVRLPAGSDGRQSLGVTITKDGLVLTCSSRLPPDLRVTTNHDTVAATLVGTCPSCDIALLQLAPGNYDFVPLCPESPRTGDWLITPNGIDPTHQLQQQCCGGLSGGAFRTRGLVSPGAVGAPLINDRAEVVGIALGRPNLYSGNQQVAASASALASFVESKGKSPGSGPTRSPADIFLESLDSIPTLANRVHPSGSNAKVSAGEAMGNYPLGLSRADLQSECGQPSTTQEQDGISRLEFSTQRIVCYIARDKVVAIETEFPFFSAGRALSVGMNAESGRFLGEYPGAVWVDQGPSTYAIAPGLELECQSGKISKIRVVGR